MNGDILKFIDAWLEDDKAIVIYCGESDLRNHIQDNNKNRVVILSNITNPSELFETVKILIGGSNCKTFTIYDNINPFVSNITAMDVMSTHNKNNPCIVISRRKD